MPTWFEQREAIRKTKKPRKKKPEEKKEKEGPGLIAKLRDVFGFDKPSFEEQVSGALKRYRKGKKREDG